MPTTFPTNTTDQYRRAIELGAAHLDTDVSMEEFAQLCASAGFNGTAYEDAREWALDYCREVLAGEAKL